MRCAIAACLLLTSACATLTQHSALNEKVGDADMSFGELRPRVRSLAGRFSGEIEQLADRITAASTSPDRQQAMLRFKINAVPQMQSALFRPDPVAALIDAWALVAQLEDAVAKVELDPAEADDATRTFTSLESDIEALWKDVTGKQDISMTKARVHAWAREHPVVGTLASRESTVDLIAWLSSENELSLTDAAAELLTATQDLAEFSELQAAFMPKQARWQAEYLVHDLARNPTLLTGNPPPGSLAAAMGALAVMLGDAPGLVANERGALLGALHAERLDTQTFVTGERMAMTRDLQIERTIVLDALRAERVAATGDMQRIGETLIDHAFERATALADRLFLRFILLVGLLVVAGTAVALLLLNSGRRHAPPPPRETAPPRVPVHP